MNVFITGASGFIGRHLVLKLLDMNFNIWCLVRKNIPSFKDANFIFGDITNPSSYDIPQCDYVFHLASQIKKTNKKQYYLVNYEGTKLLLEKCKNKNIKKFIYFSSADVYGEAQEFPLTEKTKPNPKTFYARSKYDAENIVLEYNSKFPTVVIRPPAVYGKDDHKNSLTSLIFQQVKKGWFPLVNRGNNLKEFCYVKNLVDGAILCAEKEISSGKIYLISDERPYSLYEIVTSIAKAMNVNLKIISIPYSIAYLIGKIYPTFKKLYSNFYFDISLVKKELGYKPRYSISEGILETIS